jgi:hypothetical protein
MKTNISADRNPQLHQQTIDNLVTAAHGEAFAYAKYMLYAQHARKAGRPDFRKGSGDGAFRALRG